MEAGPNRPQPSSLDTCAATPRLSQKQPAPLLGHKLAQGPFKWPKTSSMYIFQHAPWLHDSPLWATEPPSLLLGTPDILLVARRAATLEVSMLQGCMRQPPLICAMPSCKDLLT